MPRVMSPLVMMPTRFPFLVHHRQASHPVLAEFFDCLDHRFEFLHRVDAGAHVLADRGSQVVLFHGMHDIFDADDTDQFVVFQYRQSRHMPDAQDLEQIPRCACWACRS
jgi:hypothetical protein